MAVHWSSCISFPTVPECAAGQEPDGSGGCTPCAENFNKPQPGFAYCVLCPDNSGTNGESGRADCGVSQFLLLTFFPNHI